jgi:hypothetical protein
MEEIIVICLQYDMQSFTEQSQEHLPCDTEH